MVANTGSVGASLVVWLLSGLLAWTGAGSFAELGSAIPLTGGSQAYLAYSYGPLVSYLFSWTAISALKPGTFTCFPASKQLILLIRRGQRRY
jgi:amino acid transporter